MRPERLILASMALLFLSVAASTAQDRSSGGIKGKVRVETGAPAGVMVVIRQDEREVNRVVTDKSGSFLVQRLPAGKYSLTFRKPGLSVGTIENVDVKAGKTRSLGDRLVLTIDEGSIAFIRGSVFNQEGRSVGGAKVELAKIQEDGSTKKIDGRVTNETGSFVFRLTPDTARYRLTVKPGNAEPVSQDVEIDRAAVYRVAISVPAAPK
ncbi:MAG: carboxypeptidase regulatory-like domain-containing protein [Pyrinomonadaceae bacterium]|nr:carboxypeptidase regulatory-like domain-containing protein [Pyrinomonadaceae bacterium]